MGPKINRKNLEKFGYNFQGWPVSYVTSFSSRIGYLGKNMFINMVLILMIMHLAWKVAGESWG